MLIAQIALLIMFSRIAIVGVQTIILATNDESIDDFEEPELRMYMQIFACVVCLVGIVGFWMTLRWMA